MRREAFTNVEFFMIFNLIKSKFATNTFDKGLFQLLSIPEYIMRNGNPLESSYSPDKANPFVFVKAYQTLSEVSLKGPRRSRVRNFLQVNFFSICAFSAWSAICVCGMLIGAETPDYCFGRCSNPIRQKNIKQGLWDLLLILSLGLIDLNS